MVHRFGEPFNPPGVTNLLGCVGVDMDLTGIRSLNVAPIACSDIVTAGLFVDGRYFPSTGTPVSFRWFPDRIEREATHDGLRLRSTTFMPWGEAAAVVLLSVENLSEAPRHVDLRLGLHGSVTKLIATWKTPFPPAELDNGVGVDDRRRALWFRARWSRAYSLQGTRPLPDDVAPHGVGFKLSLQGREVWRATFVDAVGDDPEAVQETYDRVHRDPEGELARARREWDAELEAVFTPGNDRYSGHLPLLETADDDVARLYHTGVLGVVYFKRDNPASAIGRAYDTLMPKFWQTVTFLWDYSLSGVVHALLDPVVMRRYLEGWMATDIHTHFGTEWLTGAPVGCWYGVNDYAMVRMVHDYLRWTGDLDWVRTDVASIEGPPKPAGEFLTEYATNWERFRTANGLADYGKVGNLLECVSTYIHEVASLNAANVWAMRRTAEVLRALDDPGAAADLDDRAERLCKEVLRLYADGTGWWNTRKPDGTLVGVRHAYDLLTALNTIPEDLSHEQRDEMADAFARELRTPTWMHALSTGDPDAMFSVRPDHQWTGAYTAWPAQTASGLWRIGKVELAAEWLRGLARTANQGPFGQAHFAESVIAAEDGGSRKAPPDLPFITDWACSSGGAWASVIVESIFGVRGGLDRIEAEPAFGPLDPEARLRNLAWHGRLHDVDRTGIRERR